MPSPLSLRYIENALQKGYSEEKIRVSLKMQGINEEDINEAFKELKTKKEFLSSNVAPGKLPSQISQQQPPQSRMQYASQSGSRSGFWIFGIIVLLVAVGVGSAVYFNYLDFNKWYNKVIYFFGIGTEEVPPLSDKPFVEKPTACTLDAKECPDGSYVSRILPDCNFIECPEVAFMSENEIRIGNMGELRLEVEDYFQKNGAYPQTVVNTDKDGFYCYRKNGSHYILGTVLSEPFGALDQVSLDTDLDGNYYCGSSVKNCVDPVYCIGSSVIVPTSPSVSYYDCGLSKSLLLLNPVLNEIQPENDMALVCLGQNILLNNCKKSKAVLETFNAGKINFFVEGGNSTICNIKMTYGNADQIPFAEQKQYADTYTSCPVDIDFIKSQYPEKDPEQEPGAFTLSIYLGIGMGFGDNCIIGSLK